jgi:type IV pilus assembly protein PilA
MKTSPKPVINLQSGFTLVELMVVVAIIGLLSSVAIPNFRKYQAKSKMAEAKLNLASIYIAESAFFSNYNIYMICLAYMGYDPRPVEASRYYATGFFPTVAAISSTAWESALNSGLQEGMSNEEGLCSRTSSASGASWFPAGKGVGSAIATTRSFLSNTSLIGTQETNSTELLDTDNTSTGMTYRAAAGGIIDGEYRLSSNASLITIDHNKRMMVRRNGY